MNAVVFIIETLLSLALVAFIFRLLLQLHRADFRNPVAQAVVSLTNPLILPLRRLLPAVGKIDTASVIAVLSIAAIEVAIVFALRSGNLPNLGSWLHNIVLEVLKTTLWTYFYCIFLYAILSLIAPGGYSPVQGLLASICEPVLQPLRRLPPRIPGIDLSTLWALIAIQALIILLS
jgi:YggT family protein